MKILIIGFLVLLSWSALSTYIYVCKIRGLCYEQEAIGIVPVSQPLVREQPLIPKNLLIYFPFDKSEFNSDAETVRYYDESKAYLEHNAQARISITGHTDAVGSDEYNKALGHRRAQSLQYYFESKGMPANKIIIESKGENEPADDNNTAAGRANNRRTVIIIKN